MYESLGNDTAVAPSSAWNNYELFFNQGHLPRKAKSIQLRFSSQPNPDEPGEFLQLRGFELNDVTVVYRSI